MKKQRMLEYVLDHQEVLKELNKTGSYTISSRGLEVEGLRNTQIGKVFSFLENIDCIEGYQAQASNRVRPETLDLERLDELANLFTPDRSLNIERLAHD